MGRTTLRMVAITVLAGPSLVGCGLVEDALGSNGPERDDQGQVVAPGAVEALEIRLADCFNNPGTDAVEEVMVVPCTDLHDFEVFHSFELSNGSYPGVDAIEEQWVDSCLDRFEPFVGAPFDESVLDISAIYPTEETWNELGDREVLCSVTAVDGTRRRGSARDSGV